MGRVGAGGTYWTAALPLLALPLAWWWEEAARVRPRAAAILLGFVSAWGFVWTLGWLRQPQWLYNQPDGTNSLVVHWLGGFGERFAQLLPVYESTPPRPSAFVVNLGSGDAAHRRRRRRRMRSSCSLPTAISLSSPNG